MSKKKKVRRKSKAARATAEKREARVNTEAASGSTTSTGAAGAPSSARGGVPEGVHEAIEFKGGGGVMTKMRGGFQSAVGEGGKKNSWLSTFMWALLLLGAVFMFMGGYI